MEVIMMKFVIIFLLIIGISVFAGPNKFKEVDIQIMDYLYNAELVQADSLLNLQITQESDNPKYYLMKAHYHFYSRYFMQGLDRDSILQLIVAESNKTIALAEKMPESTEQKFYLGSAYGFLSRAYFMQQEYWDGYWAARDCRNYLEDVIDEDPSFADSYVGLGIIEYFTGLRYTGFYNFLVWFVGMSGDRQVGLEYFTIASQKGELFKNEALLILGTMYAGNENDPVRALEYLGTFKEKFQGNNFAANQYYRSVFLQRVNEEGIGFLETESDSLAIKYRITNSGTLNALGYNSFLFQNRLDEALVVFKTNLKLFPDVANCYDSLAECYLTRGENDMAIKYYKIAYEKLDSDTTINDQFREILRQGIQDRLGGLGSEINQQT
jgi:tetratricopeptide (TPR) repeat protein